MPDKILRLYDNTRISCFKTCPRKYFFRHVQDWETTKKQLPLIFGGAWHAAQEVIWPMMIGKEEKWKIAEVAFSAFMEVWTAEGLPPANEMDYEMMKEYAPRNPSVAREMIESYLDKRYDEVSKGDIELISVERSFVVPLDPDDPTLYYVGKIDKVVKQRGRYRAIEHKTTTAYRVNGTFAPTFLDSFSPNSQVDGYLYALHLTYPGEVQGVWVDAALVHKTETGFKYIPVERQLQHLDSWLWEARTWIDLIEAHLDQLKNCKPEDPYLAAFPKNTNSCFDFNTACTYIDHCKAWANPLGKPLPSGFQILKWDPVDHLENLEELLHGQTTHNELSKKKTGGTSS